MESEKIVLTPEEKLVREVLIDYAKKGKDIEYSTLIREAKLNYAMPQDRGKLGDLLGNITEYEYQHGRPLLSSIAHMHTQQGRQIIHSQGFYARAENIGFKFQDYGYKDWQEFAYMEMGKVFAFWRKPQKGASE